MTFPTPAGGAFSVAYAIPGGATPMPPTIPLGWPAGLLAVGMIGASLPVYAVLGGRRVRGRARRRG